MRRSVRVRVAASIAGGVFLVGGCGGEPENGETGAAATPTATATATAAATPEPVPKRARSARACVALWNSESVAADNYQVTAAEFVAEQAQKRRTLVRVSYERPDCFVQMPVGPRRIAWFAAPRGRAPFTNPERRNLKPGEYVPYNARALRDGRITLGAG